MGLEQAYLIYVLLGVVAGILGGLLGIGGGVVTVPGLFYVYRLLDYPQTYLIHMAIATSLAAMIFTAVAASWMHQKKKAVVWNVFKKMIPGVVVGSFAGAILAIWLSAVILEIFFGFFLCGLAVRFYWQKPADGNYRLPSRLVLWLFSSCIGALSCLLGIGGGSLTVPLLTHFGVADKMAIGTSAVVTLLTSVLGTVYYVIFAQGLEPATGSIGLVNLPSFLILSVVTFIFAPLGVKLAHQIPAQKVRKIFAIVLALTGISLII